MRQALALLVFLLAGCSWDAATTYLGPGSEYRLVLKNSGFFAILQAPQPAGNQTVVSNGSYQQSAGGFLTFTHAATSFYGLEIPGFGVFAQTLSTNPLVVPLIQQNAACVNIAAWNWVGLRQLGNSDDAAAAFFGTASLVSSVLDLTKRYNLISLSDLGSSSVTFTQPCSGGRAIGDTASGNHGWYFNGSANTMFGKMGSGSAGYVATLPQAQIFSGDLAGSFTGFIVRRVGTDEQAHFSRFAATVAGANVGFVGHPALPAADNTKSFNLNLTSFNILADGIATGTLTVGDPALAGSLSVPLSLVCAGTKTLVDFDKPVLYCVSEGYATDGSTKVGATSFHLVLRGE